MNPVRSILIIVDPTTEQQPAVTKGALLAQRFGAKLELFLCDTKASREARMTAQARVRQRGPLQSVETILESLAAPLRQQGLEVTTQTQCADPLYAALAERAKNCTADLVVKDTHHHSVARRTFLTNTDWQLIRACPVPLLLTKARPWTQVPQVFAAIDPGHVNDKPGLLDEQIVEYAAALSKRLDGRLHLLHAYVPTAVASAAAAAAVVPSVLVEDLVKEEQAIQSEIAELATRFEVAMACTHLEAGGPTEVLPRLAGTLRADIMVLGAISRSSLQRAFIGSTAEDVLEYLPCDMLIIKPPNFADLLPF